MPNNKMMPYQSAQKQELDRLGITKSPARLLEEWKSLVDECEVGYRWDISEYRNEMRSRDALGAILAVSELQTYLEHLDLMNAVANVDSRFCRLIQQGIKIPGVEPWWQAAVLRFAGEPYVDYLKSAYGIAVDLVTDE